MTDRSTGHNRGTRAASVGCLRQISRHSVPASVRPEHGNAMTDDAYSVSAIDAGHGGGPASSRRDFLTLVAGAMGVLGAGAAAYTLIDSMNPAADVLAAGEPVDVDLSKVQPGQQIIVLWRGKPIFVVIGPRR